MLDKRMLAAVLIAWAVLDGEGSLRAAEPEQTTATYGEWTVRCVAHEELPPCDMIQVAVEHTSGREVLRLSLAHLGEGSRIGVQAWVPLGVWVSAGVQLHVDGEEVALEGFGFTRCEGSGCFIESVVKESNLTPFKHGKEGGLVVLNSAGAPRGVRLGFLGFTAALEAMKARNLEWWATTRRQKHEDH